jgi:conflict system STAND superfamily ATPase/restriction endonuclease
MPHYDFLELSNLDFEELVRDLLQAEWGVRVESFKTGRDFGIDLRYTTDRTNGCVIQCKHYAVSGIRRLLSNLKLEAIKVAKLKPSRYVIATSVGLTPHNKNEIIDIFSPYIQSAQDVFGKDELNGLLRSHSEVEEANFKLWFTSTAVFERVLHNAEHCQTDFELDRIRGKLRLYVQNEAYKRALKILSKSNLVVISGVPGIGKTTLAEMLLYEHLENEFEPIVIKSDIVEAKRLFRRGKKQIFYFDDFLGQTFLRDQTGLLFRNQDQSIVDFMEMIRKSKPARFILTTREHILHNAILMSERLRHSPILKHRIVLELKDYSLLQKGRILYNHLYFSDLPAAYKNRFFAMTFIWM